MRQSCAIFCICGFSICGFIMKICRFAICGLAHLRNLQILDLRNLREVCLPTSTRHGGFHSRTKLPRFVRYSRTSKEIEDKRRTFFIIHYVSSDIQGFSNYVNYRLNRPLQKLKLPFLNFLHSEKKSSKFKYLFFKTPLHTSENLLQCMA